jgi:hypothetical protein
MKGKYFYSKVEKIIISNEKKVYKGSYFYFIHSIQLETKLNNTIFIFFAIKLFKKLLKN